MDKSRTNAPLHIIMPVYNEQACVIPVLEEWLACLRACVPHFVLCVLNDGSTDGTPALLRGFSATHPEIVLIDKPNTGHGQTCIFGYHLALQRGAEWVLQIDSDGQCDPSYFPLLWEKRNAHPVVYGYRGKREDGILRYGISRLVSIVTFLSTGTWVADPNVPYRLMSADSLRAVLPSVPKTFHLANILVSVLQQARLGIHWITISFRKRAGGTPSVKTYAFGKQGIRLFRELRQAVVQGNA